MTDLEKKLNKIYNYADLIHSENLLILSIIGSLLREVDKPEIEKRIKNYIQQRENIQKKEKLIQNLQKYRESKKK